MTGDAFPLMETLHHLSTQADVEWLLHQHRGHGVGVPLNFAMAVEVATGLLPRGICVGLRRQWPEGWTVEDLPQLLVCARPPREGAGIECTQKGMDGRVDVSQREAGVGSQPGQPPAVYHLPPDGDLGLLPRRAARAGRTAKPSW
jgi:hypothetical protein